jgi:hypothetical protein
MSRRLRSAVLPGEEESEDYCFYCGLGGQLLICDVRRCGKVYHALCLGYEPDAASVFHCPRHFCCVCGTKDRQVQASSDIQLVQCSSCPTAYCPTHAPEVQTAAKALHYKATFVSSSSSSNDKAPLSSPIPEKQLQQSSLLSLSSKPLDDSNVSRKSTGKAKSRLSSLTYAIFHTITILTIPSFLLPFFFLDKC